jgi:hypothetical protein
MCCAQKKEFVNKDTLFFQMLIQQTNKIFFFLEILSFDNFRSLHSILTLGYLFIKSSISSASIGMFAIKLKTFPEFVTSKSSSKRIPIPSSGI